MPELSGKCGVFVIKGSISEANIKANMPNGVNKQSLLLVKACEMAEKVPVRVSSDFALSDEWAMHAFKKAEC